MRQSIITWMQRRQDKRRLVFSGIRRMNPSQASRDPTLSDVIKIAILAVGGQGGCFDQLDRGFGGQRRL